MLIRTLVALRRPHLADRLEGLLDSRDVAMVRAHTAEEVWRLLHREEIDLLIVDDATAAPEPVHWIASVRGLPDAPDLIVLTEREDASIRAALLAAGSLAVLNARLSDRELRETLRTLVARLAQNASTRLAAERLGRSQSFTDIVFRSRAMSEVVAVARQVASADSSVLILGETGVGKERVARMIHQGSGRAAQPFVPVNCGAIPEGLLESELFGHEQGAFTGALRARRGHFEMAHHGTLFLDEIGELPAHLQVKLLRVLEDRRIQRLGSEQPERVDVRIIAATNRDLEAEVAARRFRADLYYRLAVVTLTIPPLRERADDVPELIALYLERFTRSLSKPGLGLAPEAERALQHYAWPGNVRELINVLERAVLLADGPRIDVDDLPRSLSAGHPNETGRAPAASGTELPLPEARKLAVAEFERRYLSELLERAGGRIGDTARLAGITPRSLHQRMRSLGLRKESFRPGADNRN